VPVIRLRRRATTAGYTIFYRLPQRVRLQLVRLAAPTFTVGAVVLLHDAEAPDPGRILLLRQPPGRGWTLPGGLLGRGEQPQDGARRELAEETGIRLEPGQLTPAHPNAVVHPKGRWIDMVYTARVPASTTPTTVDGAEVWEAVWHPVDGLPRLTRATAQMLERYGIGAQA